PQKEPGSGRVNRDRNDEECGFSYGNFGWPVASEQKEHPRKKNHGVAVRELPTAWVTVAPKDERQNSDGNPADRIICPAFSKNEEKKRTAEKDRTAKRRKGDEGKSRRAVEPFEQHCVGVPLDGLKRKQPMFVPRFVTHIRDVKVAEVED